MMEYRLKPCGDRRVYLVRDIKDRNKDSLRLFCNLPRDFLYDIHIDYVGEVKPYKANDLDYEESRQKIFDDLAIPSHQHMTIYVAVKGEEK